VEIRFFLRDHAGERLEQALDRASDPLSPHYSQHLTTAELATLLSCRSDLVVQHIHSSTNTTHSSLPVRVSLTGDFVAVTPTVSQASKIFGGLPLEEYSALQGTVEKIGVEPAHEAKLLKGDALPAEVANEVYCDYGFGLALSAFTPRHRHTRRSGSGYYPPNTPKDLYKIYNYTAPAKWASTNGANAIFMESSGMKDRHVKKFFKEYVPELVGETPELVYGTIQGSDDGEGAMDLEYIMTFGRYLPTKYYDFNYNNFPSIYEEPAEWASMLVDAQTTYKPWSASSSYGPSAPNTARQEATDRAFTKAGAVGVSIIFANGDDSCDILDDCSAYNVDRPAGPHTTLVGGVSCDSTSGARTVWDGTSGGFTSHWDLPSWQKDAVEHYFNVTTDLPTAHMYDRTKRGDPDVGLCAGNIVSYDVHGDDPGGGTSFSSPAFAGMISSLNQHRAAKNKAPLGFLNPLLYHLHTTCADCFYDVTEGSNKSPNCPCSGNDKRNCDGWHAAPGWDPTTGVGIPQFNNILREVMLLP